MPEPDLGPPIVVTAPNQPTTWQGIAVDDMVPGDSNDREYSEYLNAKAAFETAEEEAPETPCVTAAPSEGNLNEMNRHAKAAVTAMINNDGGHREILTVIYMDGSSMRKIMLQTSNQQNFVHLDFSQIPGGVVIIGAVHTHIARPGEQVGYPSDEDRAFFANMERYFEDNDIDTTISFNPVMYIYDGNRNQTHVYDRYKIDFEVLPGCAI